MLKFEFRDDKIVTSWQFFLFEEFTSIWKMRDKKKANQILHFIFLLADISDDNPLLHVKPEKREEEALFRAFGKRSKVLSDKELLLIEPALKLYTKLNMAPEEQLLKTFDEKLSEISHTLNTTVPETVINEESGVVTFTSNSKIITSSLSKLSKLRKSREKIVASIKKEAINQRVRGKIYISPLSKGLIHIQ